MENRFNVQLSSGASQVITGAGTIKNLQSFQGKKIVLFADKRLNEITEKIQRILDKNNEVFTVQVKAGESLKSFTQLEVYYEKFVEFGLNRHAVLVALGGGTIGDVGGFLAATYMRGINWIGLPTTLLAQVDSSLGGKTGVNLSSGKNLVGAFCQPEMVICDTDFLQSLHQRDVISGLGEVLKYGLVFDPEFFGWICSNWKKLCERDSEALTDAVHQSLKWKARAIEDDEFDLKGIRENLNFGHTMGHAFEALGGYSQLRHGEAVILGMIFAIHLSVVRGHMDRNVAKKILENTPQWTLGIPNLKFEAERTLPFLKKDKKNFGDMFTFVLLKDIGETVRDSQISRDHIEQAFGEFN